MTEQSPNIFSSVSCNLDNALLQTCLPLFKESKVEAIEWSFDTLYNTRNIPEWFTELLSAFAVEGRLIGHGVYFSIFSGKWSTDQQNWLNHLKKVSTHFKFDHITEHFGFMTGADFHQGAPISVPFTTSTLALGVDRLKRIYDSCHCPVGLENLAFSYSLDEVKAQGEFLEKLIAPINGFIILDLHNVYCQLKNFDLDFNSFIKLFPLNRVREIHISGGSWEDSEVKPTKSIRRDTHDDAVPNEVFELLEKSLPLLPNLKFVVLEQMGIALENEIKKQQFQNDFNKMQQIVKAFCEIKNQTSDNLFIPNEFQLALKPYSDKWLYLQQTELSVILESAKNYEDASIQLEKSSLKNTEWQIENWSSHMLETAIRIAQKWKKGWNRTV